MNTKKIKLIIVLMLCVIATQAKISVASILTDHMVLQRNSEVKIWGMANANQKITVQAEWNNQKVSTIANSDGKWIVKIATSNAGGPYRVDVMSGNEKLTIKDVLLGEVWLCSGQSNMDMRMSGMTDSPINGSTDAFLAADNSQIRMFNVARKTALTPLDSCTGSWKVASSETVWDYSAVGYFFAKKLQAHFNVPVGIVNSSWGGSRIEAWIANDVIVKQTGAYKQTTTSQTAVHHRASNLYNGMIAPIVNFKFKGALWYQGESNLGNYYDYAALMADMVKNWRADFETPNLSFYYVQIAPYKYPNNKPTDAAFLREAQERALKLIPNSAIVSTIDIGEENNIHPAEKKLISDRLFLCALSETYNVKGLPYKSPSYKSMSVKDNVATLSFDHNVKGFHTAGKQVDCFEVAGADSVFYPATVSVKNGQLLVQSDKVMQAVAVRYAFKNYMDTRGFIFNTTGLPLLPFRTDSWQKK